MDYRAKVVIVTGASSGIGYVTARSFAQRGAIVIAVARREARLQELIASCRQSSPESSYLAGDLGQLVFAERVVAETVAQHGRLDILVNNAAIPKHKHILHLSAEEAETVMRTNFLSCMWTTLAAIPHLFDSGGGAIVNVSSFVAKVVPPRESVYAASKAAMSAFSEGLWIDLAGSNIHVALIHPGPIDTEIWDKADETMAYKGPRYPAQLVADAVFEAIEKRRYEMTVPKRNLQLMAARLLRLLCPAVLRMGMLRMDPMAPEWIEAVRRRKREGS